MYSDYKWPTGNATCGICVSRKKAIPSSQIQRRSPQHIGVYYFNLILLFFYGFQWLVHVTLHQLWLQLRVSGLISNGPYVLAVDCDMYCNDPSSAKQAMCFFLDPETSKYIAFVQFPQMFHNLSKKDIYDNQSRTAFKVNKHFLSLLLMCFILLFDIYQMT